MRHVRYPISEAERREGVVSISEPIPCRVSASMPCAQLAQLLAEALEQNLGGPDLKVDLDRIIAAVVRRPELQVTPGAVAIIEDGNLNSGVAAVGALAVPEIHGVTFAENGEPSR
jgi:hypothetical protein